MEPNGDEKTTTPDAKPEHNAEPKALVPNTTATVPDTVDASYFVDAAGGKPRKRKLPQWLDHFNARDLKMLFKASLAVWVMTILIFINDALDVLGQAAFFGR
jgi:hypothetical protein